MLRQLDLDASRPYWVQASHLKRIVALVEGSPPYLAERMRLIEPRLAGDDRVVLSAAPTAQAERIKGCRGIAEAQLWSLPYETWFQRIQLGDASVRRLGSVLQRVASGALWKGRVRHLEHKFTGEDNAPFYYGRARPLDRDIDALGAEPIAPEGGSVKPGSQHELELAATAGASLKAIARLVKQNAGYWLGLMAWEQGRSDRDKYKMAVDYLANGTLNAYPDGPWTPGARYNLGRTYEAQKDYPKAIQQYRSNAGSAQSYGEQLRARWLEKATGTELPGLPGLPGLSSEKEPAKPEGPAKKEPPAKEEPKKEPAKGGSDLPALPGLPGLPDLPPEKEPAVKSPPKETPKPPPPAKAKPGVPDLPSLPGLE